MRDGDYSVVAGGAGCLDREVLLTISRRPSGKKTTGGAGWRLKVLLPPGIDREARPGPPKPRRGLDRGIAESSHEASYSDPSGSLNRRSKWGTVKPSVIYRAFCHRPGKRLH